MLCYKHKLRENEKGTTNGKKNIGKVNYTFMHTN